jgi:hypothetical protein
VLAEYTSWRFEQPLERWQIGANALRVFLDVLRDPQVDKQGSVCVSRVRLILV